MKIKDLLKEIKKRAEKDKDYLNRDLTFYANWFMQEWEYEIKWVDDNIKYWIMFYI